MSGDPDSTSRPSAPAAAEQRSLGRRFVFVAACVLLVVAVVAIGSAFLPRWWAQKIGDQVDGSMARGIVFGLFYGFVFTILPLGLLRWLFRRRRSWTTIGWGLAGAIVLATPNLITLAIVVGTGNAAHAGERTLDVRAPGFRYSTLVAAVGAAVFLLAIEYLLLARRRTGRRADRLDEQLRELRAPAATAPPEDDPAQAPPP